MKLDLSNCTSLLFQRIYNNKRCCLKRSKLFFCDFSHRHLTITMKAIGRKRKRSLTPNDHLTKWKMNLLFIEKRTDTWLSRSGVNFTNILRAALMLEDPISALKLLNLTFFFALLGSARLKAAHRMLVKLTSDRLDWSLLLLGQSTKQAREAREKEGEHLTK